MPAINGEWRDQLDRLPLLLSFKLVAETLNVSVSTVRRLVAGGHLKYVRLGAPGSTVRITRQSVIKMLTEGAAR